MKAEAIRARGRRRARHETGEQPPGRQVDYWNLRNPFPPTPVFSEDRVEAMHRMALRVLQELGLKVLLPDARRRFAAAGALVDEDSQMVRIGEDIVEAALATAPRSVVTRGGTRARDLTLELGTLTILSGAGAPHAADMDRGRRPATIADFEEITRLTQAFDVLHMIASSVEPQDVPVHLRHYATVRAQLALSDKLPFIFGRGTPQVRDGFAMIRDFRGLSEAEFVAAPWCYTVINTNSPRQIDVPMAQGLIDFAEAGQLSIVTPFCMMGAMAPVTVAGALVLSHAEALAGIVLTQLARPGAPVLYGAFASNVDMKSGAPAFGTPEQVKANLGAGQLARRVGLPWRCAAGCAANASDAQAAQETVMSAWGAVLAGCTVLLHAAGWLEGGLTVGYEKMITDLEAMQVFAELCAENSRRRRRARLGGAGGSSAWRALLRLRPHHGALSHGLLSAARRRLVELRHLDRARREGHDRARQRAVEADPCRAAELPPGRGPAGGTRWLRCPTHRRGWRSARELRTGANRPGAGRILAALGKPLERPGGHD